MYGGSRRGASRLPSTLSICCNVHSLPRVVFSRRHVPLICTVSFLLASLFGLSVDGWGKFSYGVSPCNDLVRADSLLRLVSVRTAREFKSECFVIPSDFNVKFCERVRIGLFT